MQQILSVIAQHGGAIAADMFRALCGPGPFERVDSGRFVQLLRAMAAAELLTQTSDGTLLHGAVGERIVNHYSFYTAFQTPEEWKLVAAGRTLGSIPITQPLVEGGMLIFAGRRWKITGIDIRARIVELVRAAGGAPPHFGGTGALIGDKIRSEMVDVYKEEDVPGWMDRQSRILLAEGRAAWRRLDLDRGVLIESVNGTIALPWQGDRALLTASLVLASKGVEGSVEGPALAIGNRSAAELVAVARQLLDGPAPDPVSIARHLQNTEIDKWDWVLDGDLAAEAAAARLLDVPGAWHVLRRIADEPDDRTRQRTLPLERIGS